MLYMLLPPSLLLPLSISFQEIARLGFWALTEMQLCYLLTGLKAAILLAMGGWDKDQPNMYWAERFMCTPPACLVDVLMPWLKDLRTAVEEADAAGQAVHFSARGLLRLLPLLAYVVVQDALDLCADGRPEKYKANPVHKLLLEQPLFRCAMKGRYSAAKPHELQPRHLEASAGVRCSGCWPSCANKCLPVAALSLVQHNISLVCCLQQRSKLTVSGGRGGEGSSS